MPLKGGETDYPKKLVDFGAVVDKLKGFAVKHRTFIGSEPLAVHIHENAAEAAAYELVKGAVLQPCKGFISVAEYPVHRLTVLVKHNLNIGKGNGDIVKALVMLVIFIICHGIVAVHKLFNDNSLLFVEFLDYLLSVQYGIFQRIAV